jgi:hypothetical protein
VVLRKDAMCTNRRKNVVTLTLIRAAKVVEIEAKTGLKCYRFIPEERKKLAVTMLHRAARNIENANGINVRTVQCVRRLWLVSTGRVDRSSNAL